ncbi:MAG TPA: hypothetical protein VMX11_08020 [Actinomycetes bacterium]|nr:hypothetical protein [Actinomycetes bacterium]
MTPDIPDATAPPSVPPQVRLLSVAVLAEAAAMVVFIVVDLVGALNSGDAEWGAVWFVAVVMGLWSAGLVVVSRGVLAGRRWAFTPILFTQGLFGIAAITFFGAAAPVARVVWGVVVVVAVVVLRLLFSREVRQHLIYDNS